jgi:hypothetical protein
MNNTANIYRTLNDSNSNFNYEEEEAREWRQSFFRANRREEDTRYKNETNDERVIPDEVWLVSKPFIFYERKKKY